MSYRRDLERLTTLSSQEIDDACGGTLIPALVNRCIEQMIELTGLAEDAFADDSFTEHVAFMQEISAWRETASLLRIMSADVDLTEVRIEHGAA